MDFMIWQAFVLLFLAWTATAQLILSPSNTTTTDPAYHSGAVQVAIWHQPTASPVAAFLVTALTQAAADNIPSAGLSGHTFVVNANNQLTVESTDVALIDCDPSSGNIGPEYIFNTATTRRALAIILYSTTAQTCHGSGFGTYANVYTMKSLENSQSLMAAVDTDTAYASLMSRDAVSGNGTSPGGTTNGQNPSPLGPSPSTAVAMIILYSITGVITALFLCIIITGAVRAHRHPERYGPRNLAGRPRQTRARGLARAMLDSLPIVKVGDRTDHPAKPTEVELESGQHGQVESVGDQTTTPTVPATATAAATTATPDSETPRNGTSTEDAALKTTGSGIAAAAAATGRSSTNAEEDSKQGCSICTEDFNVGEDQRVLPCDHRFHPECIDPWLLNVSGTCPLCRIDLRPADNPEDAAEVDEHGNPIASSDRLAPPLDHAEGSRAARVRRSIMVGILGSPRPERMSREERVSALRRYRESTSARGAEQAQGSSSDIGEPEEETSRRRRLRDLFRIRTRRTGEPETVREEPASQVAASSVPSTEARTS